LERKLFPDGMTPEVVNIFHGRELDSLDEDEIFTDLRSFFVEAVSASLSKQKGNLAFALEDAARSTKQQGLKELFEYNRYAPKERKENPEDFCCGLDLLIQEMIGIYTPPGAFGKFIGNV